MTRAQKILYEPRCSVCDGIISDHIEGTFDTKKPNHISERENLREALSKARESIKN